MELSSLEETLLLGRRIGSKCRPGDVFLLYGELGAGKTSFAQGVGEALGIQEPIQSPTFTYLNIYQGRIALYHFDLYRLKNVDDFFGLGFEEYLAGDGVALIEWPQRLGSFVPKGARSLSFSYFKKGRICTGDLWDF